MTDKELLEKAAKAACLDLEWCEFWGCMAKNLGVIDGFDRHTCWNPLADDGDALRLAVKLRILISPEIGYTNVINDLGAEFFEMYSDHGGDYMKATRRAITRAAALVNND